MENGLLLVLTLSHHLLLRLSITGHKRPGMRFQGPSDAVWRAQSSMEKPALNTCGPTDLGRLPLTARRAAEISAAEHGSARLANLRHHERSLKRRGGIAAFEATVWHRPAKQMPRGYGRKKPADACSERSVSCPITAFHKVSPDIVRGLTPAHQ